MQQSDRFQRAVALIDAENAADPRHDLWQGESYPRELLYGRRMSEVLSWFAPEAAEAVRLAVRCQHIGRWQISRSTYPAGRSGYLRWRKSLQRFHAEKATALLQEAGYEKEIIEKVQFLLLKKGLKRGGGDDSDSSLLEDVACLVFLQYYLPDFYKKYQAAEKKPADNIPQSNSIARKSNRSASNIEEIVAKVWRKMSEQGRQASQRIDLPPISRQLLRRSVAG